jgi:class 3 adenylate cyclase
VFVDEATGANLEHFATIDRGVCNLKGFDQPMRLFEVRRS